ncbi:MAG: GIY-YIG nuclease family protein [Candidatus Gracilibacteria bacterium]
MTRFQVYILESEKDQKHYTGYTKDLERRLIEHNEGRVQSTRNRRPLKLIYTETFSSSVEARKKEKFFKTRQGRRELKKNTGK